jgi:hypothetical protein
MARKHVAPSRLRYERSHPCVSLRLTQEELKTLREIQQRTGLSLAEITRRSLGAHRRQTREAYERGRKAGYQDGLGRFEAPCKICHQPMHFDLKSAGGSKAAEVIRQAFSSWGHPKCLESGR